MELPNIKWIISVEFVSTVNLFSTVLNILFRGHIYPPRSITMSTRSSPTRAQRTTLWASQHTTDTMSHR